MSFFDSPSASPLMNPSLKPMAKFSQSVKPLEPLTPPPERDDLVMLWEKPIEQTIVKPEPSPASIVAVIGVGYVGLHLAQTFSRVYSTIAYDVSEARLSEVQTQLDPQSVKCTSNASAISQASHILIAVPTVLKHDSTIDDRHLQSAIRTVEQHARPGATIIVESSVAVGMTRNLLTSVMRSRGLKAGMSPERVDPGRVFPAYEDIPKIISGLDDVQPGSLESIHELYSRVFNTLVPVSSPEVAEMTKLYENCQRMMCIAYANEMADACNQYSRQTPKANEKAVEIDPWEVCRAAATKPFGYLPCQPSLGVGGHCIPVNPYYLLSNMQFPLLQACTETMKYRPMHMAEQLLRSLSQKQSSGVRTAKSQESRSRILVIGMGFKRGQSVLCSSPGVALVKHLLATDDVYVEWADPLVTAESLAFAPKMDDKEDWTQEYLQSFDAIVVAMRQIGLDLSVLDRLDGVVVEKFDR